MVELSDILALHLVKLGADHIHHFDSDPMSETDGDNHNFIILKVELVFENDQIRIESGTPNERYLG